MAASLILQYVVIAVAVLVSALFVWKSRFPLSLRRARLALALPLVREGRPAWMRRCGKWIAPQSLASGNVCGGCDGCD